MSLYNEIRPRKLSEVRGQDVTKRQIAGMLSSGHIPNAMLLVGPRGTGKTTVARIIARTLCCEKGGDTPCGECESCRTILAGTSTDVVELDAASNNKVEDVHRIVEASGFAPVGKKKVFILDEVHMFSAGAWNALLKTIEEPPKDVVFMLCTTEEGKVPATIISRCRKITFEKIDLPVVYEALKDACDRYGKAYEDDALKLIAKASEGCMRDALSILETFFDADGLTAANVSDALGLSREEVLFGILDGISRADSAKAIQALREATDKGVSLSAIAKGLCTAIADTLFLQGGAAAGSVINTESYREALQRFAETANTDRCLELSRRLSEAYLAFSKSVDAEFLLESAILGAIMEETAISTLTKRVDELEKQLAEGITVTSPVEAEVPSHVEGPVPAAQSTIQPVNQAATQTAEPVAAPREDFPLEEDQLPEFTDTGALGAEVFDASTEEVFEDNKVLPFPVTDANTTSEKEVKDIPVSEPSTNGLGDIALPEGTQIVGSVSLFEDSDDDLMDPVTATEPEEPATPPAGAGQPKKEEEELPPIDFGGLSGFLWR